jgi:hypothetical protein
MALMCILANFTAFLTGGPAAPRFYIDPNTGGMLFQMLAVILALFSGILFFFSRKIKELFARLRRKLRKEPDMPAAEEPKPEE